MKAACPLLPALGVERGRVLSLAGGGGKTSLMYALARAVVSQGWRAVTTTTTRIYPPGADESPALVLLGERRDGLDLVRRRLAEAAHVTVAHGLRPDGKLAGIAPTVVDEMAAAAVADLIVVEADGSAGRPLKAAREGEPVFPACSTDCVAIMGVEALGMPLDDPWVFRAALASEITGLPRGAPVTPAAVVELLIGPRGVARPAPPTSRLLVFINKVETPEHENRAYDLARLLLARGEPRLARVVVGNLRRAAAGFALFARP